MKPLTYRTTINACYTAYITQAIVNNLLPLLFIIFQTNYQISFAMLGNLVLVNFVTQLVVDALAVRFVDKLGYRPCIIAAHLLACLGLVLLGILPGVMAQPYVGVVLAVIVYAIGGGLIEVMVSPIVDAIPGDAKESAMSLLHSFYCWGQVAVVLVSTLALRAMGQSNWQVLPLVWAVVPLLNCFLFARVPLVPPLAAHERMPLKKLLSSGGFIIAMLLMVCAGASEQAMSQWSSLFAEKGLGIPKVMGDLLGPCLFGVFMGVGRMLYGLYGQRIKIRNALLLCAGLCVVSYLAAGLLSNPFLALLGCALCGFSVSLMWPGVFSLTSAGYPAGGTAMFAILAICGDLGCASGPWLTGMISDAAQKWPLLINQASAQGVDIGQLGLKAGLLAAVIFPVVLLVGIMLLRKNKPANQ